MAPAVKPLRLDGRRTAANVEVCGWGRPPLSHHKARRQDMALGTSGARVGGIISNMEDDEFELPAGVEAGDEPPFENRIHDELVEEFGAPDTGTTAANISRGGGRQPRSRTWRTGRITDARGGLSDSSAVR
jgi:hypothetical protein